MTAAVSVKSVKAKQDVLQKAYNKARLVWDKASGELRDKKIELCTFNDKYGRVIAMMEEDSKNED